MAYTSQPPYIYRGGSMMMHPPFEQQDSLLFGFFVKGDMAKLQALCDQQLNAVAQGKYRFEPLMNYVLLTFTLINKDYSLYPEDQAKGWGREYDTSFWVPVGQYAWQNGKKVLEKIHWIMPYIWVDQPMTILNGREIFGYPKYLGAFQMPDCPAQANFFSLDVNAFKTYSPDTECATHRLLDVKRTCGTEPLSNDAHWKDFAGFAKGVFEAMCKVGDFMLTSPELDAQLLQDLLSPQLPQLFLKQFPDGSGTKAVYQALTTSAAKINGFHGAAPLLADYEFTLQAYASEPIAQDLGVQLGAQDVAFAFWVNFDFSIEPAEELVNNSLVQKQKIAVLGGGLSAMTAVYAITSQPDWQSRYDIDVYQMGWRIGGKGASGRNPQLGQRIEEHGLHIWFGFYENAFKVMRELYDELNRPAGAALQKWDDAFKQQSFVLVDEYINGKWEAWPFEFPVKPGIPGDGAESPSLWAIVQTVIAWIKQEIGNLLEAVTGIDTDKPRPPASHGFFGNLATRVYERVTAPIEALAHEAVNIVGGLVKMLDVGLVGENPEDLELIVESLQSIKKWVEHMVEDFIEDHTQIRRLFIGIDLAMTCVIGMVMDGVLIKGFSVINDIDFKDWLRKHGANEKITVNSAPVRGLYDLVFAYEGGDVTRPNLEAGTCLSGAMRIVFCYKGSVMWKMQAGMGDVVFTPLYQVLKRRGVNFHYFHKVENLTPDAFDKTKVASIRMTQQVKLSVDEYYPLVEVKDLACWPSYPIYGQIDPAQAQLLQDNNINLESNWSNWPELYQQTFGTPLPEVTLEAGKDFDLIIFGMSIASVPVTCSELLPLSPQLQACVDNVQTVVTQAYQLWLTEDLKTLGWTLFPENGQEPVLTSFTEPLDTWASMDQLICREDWPANGPQAKNIAYFCGVQAINQFPPFSDHAFPDQCKALVKAAAVDQLNQQIHWLWPNADTPTGFKWDWLLDTQPQVGEARFDSQYWRSNIDPSERYVLSVVNSTKYRIATDGTGFNNIYFTGDWIKNGINAGCVEGAVQSGLQTSRAICGYPKIIKGERDFIW